MNRRAFSHVSVDVSVVVESRLERRQSHPRRSRGVAESREGVRPRGSNRRSGKNHAGFDSAAAADRARVVDALA